MKHNTLDLSTELIRKIGHRRKFADVSSVSPSSGGFTLTKGQRSKRWPITLSTQSINPKVCASLRTTPVANGCGNLRGGPLLGRSIIY